MQKYIGNIIVSNLNYKIDSCFKKCKSMDEIDDGLPVLIIGLKNAKNIIVNFNILKREYDDKRIWWTLSKIEKRVDYDKNVNDFYEFCIRRILKEVKYLNINIIDLNYPLIRKWLKYVKNNNITKTYYVDNNKFIFVYDTGNNHIYGFSLNTAAFFGIKREKILSLFESNKKFRRIKNFYAIPNNIRGIISDNIPDEMVLIEYFTKNNDIYIK